MWAYSKNYELTVKGEETVLNVSMSIEKRKGIFNKGYKITIAPQFFKEHLEVLNSHIDKDPNVPLGSSLLKENLHVQIPSGNLPIESLIKKVCSRRKRR